jgi:hypothetical protein
MMVTIYVVLTAYFFVRNCPPRIAFALRDAVAPFQIKARARKAGAERSAAGQGPRSARHGREFIACVVGLRVLMRL